MRAWPMIAALALAGCAAKRLPPPPPAPVRAPTHVGLEPGWRVKVITPVLRSGGFLLKSDEQHEDGNTITVRVGDEFLGYETAIHALRKGKRGGVRVAPAEVTLNKSGQLTHPPKPFAPRLRVPGRLEFVHLLFMQAASDADHNMAVLAATDGARLAELTERVQASPATACRSSRKEYCEWVPAGVAVRAERPQGADWVPAR